MPAKPNPRCSSIDDIVAVLREHVKVPDGLVYREKLGSGATKVAALIEHRPLLLALRAGPCKDAVLGQKIAEEAP